MQQNDIELLLKKYQAGECSPEEVAFLESWYAQWNQNKPISISDEQLAEDLHLISSNIEPLYIPSKQHNLWPRFAIAASILFVLAVGGYFLTQNKINKPVQTAQNHSQDILPGSNQATLTLANGKKIILSKGLSGKLAQQGNTQIHVNGASEVVYTEAGKTAQVEYNTLSTAKGEVSPYPLVLPDGTKVWLNAQSSIKFPTAFADTKRHVEITGEAYFEVAHNAAKAFTVKAGSQIVEDIGTAFNINSYADEPNIKTTLVEGAAKVIANGISKTLAPGQRTVVAPNSFLIQVADSEEETAWMTGRFIFHDEELHIVMRQLARWYNIDVVYDYNPDNVILGGGFSKSRNIAKVLKSLEQTGAIKFKIDGRVVHITK